MTLSSERQLGLALMNFPAATLLTASMALPSPRPSRRPRPHRRPRPYDGYSIFGENVCINLLFKLFATFFVMYVCPPHFFSYRSSQFSLFLAGRELALSLIHI